MASPATVLMDNHISLTLQSNSWRRPPWLKWPVFCSSILCTWIAQDIWHCLMYYWWRATLVVEGCIGSSSASIESAGFLPHKATYTVNWQVCTTAPMGGFLLKFINSSIEMKKSNSIWLTAMGTSTVTLVMIIVCDRMSNLADVAVDSTLTDGQRDWDMLGHSTSSSEVLTQSGTNLCILTYVACVYFENLVLYAGVSSQCLCSGIIIKTHGIDWPLLTSHSLAIWLLLVM